MEQPNLANSTKIAMKIAPSDSSWFGSSGFRPRILFWNRRRAPPIVAIIKPITKVHLTFNFLNADNLYLSYSQFQFYTLTYQHIDISTYRRINILTYQCIDIWSHLQIKIFTYEHIYATNVSTYQHINILTLRHINMSTYQHMNTSTFQYINKF